MLVIQKSNWKWLVIAVFARALAMLLHTIMKVYMLQLRPNADVASLARLHPCSEQDCIDDLWTIAGRMESVAEKEWKE